MAGCIQLESLFVFESAARVSSPSCLYVNDELCCQCSEAIYVYIDCLSYMQFTLRVAWAIYEDIK